MQHQEGEEVCEKSTRGGQLAEWQSTRHTLTLSECENVFFSVANKWKIKKHPKTNIYKKMSLNSTCSITLSK